MSITAHVRRIAITLDIMSSAQYATTVVAHFPSSKISSHLLRGKCILILLRAKLNQSLVLAFCRHPKLMHKIKSL